MEEELGVKENKFYPLTKRKEKVDLRLYADLETSIKRIREYLKQGMEPKKFEFVTLEEEEDKYEIKDIAWSFIASKLVKEGRNY